MTESKPRVIVIAGPTASNKTAVGLELAEMCAGEIVSADSVQIYRYMDIGSAKPTREERARVIHHMIDVRYPDEDFSAGKYVREARQRTSEILHRRHLPLVVGGTGLYIKLLLGGIALLPAAHPELRRKLADEEQEGGKGTLFKRLTKLDPLSADRIPPENMARVIRALEVIELTGKSLSEVQERHGFRDRPYKVLFICLDPGRALLYERIDKRVDSMIKGGLIEEVSRLYALGYFREHKSMQSLGYRHAGMVLAGETSLGEATRLMKRDTRHYAKRQVTWFRSEPGVLWCDPDDIKGIGLKVSNFLGY
ncbi:MAG: tRNA (adenosine(37)-N6)-dimethylallyltransferase MiaA [Desulfomonilaceae bacterium]